MSPRYFVYVSDRGNVFMTEIAAVLAAALSDLGRGVIYPAPGLPERGVDRVNLVVAPHEFFALQPEATESVLLQAAEASVCVGVEQPGTDWFELGTHYASVGPGVFDISPYAVAELTGRGLDAHHLQLGYHHSWDRWDRSAEHRPTDLLFLGSMTERREDLLSSMAPLLWDRQCDLRLFEFPRPMSEPRANFVAGTPKWDLLADSRVLLNIHRNDVPYFEWVRVLEAVVNGCLVVTESSTDYGPLVPGEHLVAAPAEYLGAYTASILGDEVLRCELATSAYDFVRTKLELTAALEPLCAHAEALFRRPARAVEAHPFRPLVVDHPPAQPALQSVLEGEDRMRVRIKELLDSETRLVQRVEALGAQLVYGDEAYAQVTDTPAWEGFTPEVSVLVTSYNYCDYVTDALASVLASEDVAVELVVVDDHSVDGSVEAITAFMAGAPFHPIRLVARAANAGVGAARNLGVAHTRSGRVFMLDADNAVYPSALRKLADALDAEPQAAFSYGIVAKVGQGGLLSHLPWDVERLTICNYIDAMALIRSDRLVALGGYDKEYSVRGWEDFELWLRMAAAGDTGAFVPEFVGAYRVHSVSRQVTVGLDTGQLMRDLIERYPFLPWPEQ